MGDETSLRYESGFSLTEAQKHRTLGVTEVAFGIANRTKIDSPKNTPNQAKHFHNSSPFQGGSR